MVGYPMDHIEAIIEVFLNGDEKVQAEARAELGKFILDNPEDVARFVCERDSVALVREIAAFVFGKLGVDATERWTSRFCNVVHDTKDYVIFAALYDFFFGKINDWWSVPLESDDWWGRNKCHRWMMRYEIERVMLKSLKISPTSLDVVEGFLFVKEKD